MALPWYEDVMHHDDDHVRRHAKLDKQTALFDGDFESEHRWRKRQAAELASKLELVAKLASQRTLSAEQEELIYKFLSIKDPRADKPPISGHMYEARLRKELGLPDATFDTKIRPIASEDFKGKGLKRRRYV